MYMKICLNFAGPDLERRHWTGLQATLTTDESLARRGFRLELDKFVIKHDGFRSLDGCISNKMTATTFEAIIRAVYENTDGDMDSVTKLMEHLEFGVDVVFENVLGGGARSLWER
jgi:dsRNA-specific ribonuclease